jgi:hypothetical protein
VASADYLLTAVVTTAHGPHQHTRDHGVPPPPHVRASWHVDRATSFPKILARIVVFAGLVGAWRLMRMCRASREGAKGHLRTLPGQLVVVYGGRGVYGDGDGEG